jgi:hypothetical protein
MVKIGKEADGQGIEGNGKHVDRKGPFKRYGSIATVKKE